MIRLLSHLTMSLIALLINKTELFIKRQNNLSNKVIELYLNYKLSITVKYESNEFFAVSFNQVRLYLSNSKAEFFDIETITTEQSGNNYKM